MELDYKNSRVGLEEKWHWTGRMAVLDCYWTGGMAKGD